MHALTRRLPRCATAVLRGGRTLLITTAALLCPGASAGQEVTPPPPAETAVTMRLGDLYAQVDKANPRLAVARARTTAARARVPGATRPPDPQLQFGFMNYMVPNVAPMPLLGMRQVQVMQMLPLGGKLALSGQVADAQAIAVSERGEEVRWELRSETAMAFYDLYATDRRLDVMRGTLRLLQEIEKSAAAMYRVGDGRQADVLRAQVEIARMVADTVRMVAMREGMVAALNALRDVPTKSPIGTPALPQFPDSVPSVAHLDSLAREHRPMIRAGIEEVHAADAAARLARREIFPDVQIGAQFAQRGDDMGGTERMGSLMIGASLPIFARARQYRMREESEAMRQMARADVAAMRAYTRGKIGTAYANLTRSRHLTKLYRTTVLPQADATLASSLAAFRVGAVDFMTLLDNQMTVNNYRQELFALEAEQGKVWAELEMLTGRVLIDAHRLSTALWGDK